MSMYSLLIEPILTEKSNMLRTEPRGTEKRYYVFKVRQDANKTELMKAVEKIFNVHPFRPEHPLDDESEVSIEITGNDTVSVSLSEE